MRRHSISLIFAICVLLFVGFVSLACFSGAWESTAIASQILSALSGAVVAAIITLFLLQGQMASEEKKEKKSKIFEEKLKIYQGFLEELCNVVKNQNIDEEEEIRLQFQVASIAMHTTEKSILDISEQVKTIIWNIKENTANRKEVLSQLFTISDIFHQELYNHTVTLDEKNRMRTIQNFHVLLMKETEIEEHKKLI